MRPEQLFELKELIASAKKARLYYFYPEVEHMLNQVEEILNAVQVEFPHYCTQCNTMFVTDKLEAICPVCDSVDVVIADEMEVPEEPVD